MMALSDTIEQFINELLESGGASQVELRRNELATFFQCAPSQINYVLSTRFTLDRGYIIESRKGGGGCIRVIRISQDCGDYLVNLISDQIGEEITAKRATAIVLSLIDAGIINRNEASLIVAAVSDKAITLPISVKDRLRADILKSILTAILQWNP